MRIGVKPGVLRNRAEDCARAELMPIRQTHRHAFLVQVVRGWLRNESIDIHVLLPQRERIHREHQDVCFREDGLDGRKGAKPLFLADVIGPRQAAHRALFHVVLKNLRKEQFVGN